MIQGPSSYHEALEDVGRGIPVVLVPAVDEDGDDVVVACRLIEPVCGVMTRLLSRSPAVRQRALAKLIVGGVASVEA